MKGFTLIETLIGIVLMLIIFLGIFGVYQLGFRVIGQSRARITAIALANQKMEFIRNLSYNDIGTDGGIPSGNISQTEVIVKNDVSYTVETNIGYVDDPFDDVAPADSLPNDYKKVKVKVSWGGQIGGETIFITDVAPKGLETSVGGGNLLIKVFNALGVGVGQANIHLVNSTTSPPIDVNYQTNNDGDYLVAGAPASVNSYEITITKDGYSADRTYSTAEVANPAKPHATVIEGSLTQVSFLIDLLSSFSIDTVSPYGIDGFSDSFLDQTKVSEFSDVFVGGGEVTLATTTATTTEYKFSGYLVSDAIFPSNLMLWNEFSWNDNEPLNTRINYQVFYATGTDWFLVPDIDLPGNSAGFDIAPVDLSALATTTYGTLKVKGSLSTGATSTTPVLYDWQVSWKTNESTPIGNVPFRLRGDKTIGTDLNDGPVYKYLQDHISDAGGHIDIPNLEWDLYTFSLDGQPTSLDLIDTSPSPQPVNLVPNFAMPVTLFLSAENSLLFKVKDADTSDDIFSANVRIYNVGLSYDETLNTDENGEVLFIPLESATYNFEVQAVGYQNSSGSVSVSGDEIKIINLTPGEL